MYKEMNVTKTFSSPNCLQNSYLEIWVMIFDFNLKDFTMNKICFWIYTVNLKLNLRLIFILKQIKSTWEIQKQNYVHGEVKKRMIHLVRVFLIFNHLSTNLEIQCLKLHTLHLQNQVSELEKERR
jgi:hypothetical protein